ncbi:hypothetical protein C1645_836384 [Glomus cerebriforme]|uniref:TRP C-terminal domain-containing protein n=1 Tax=Glomus cerebriforme TaxID=658196 RepID=A0A397S5Y6_9GLOM|nr:hypothetical protein C1645_836384 [Glomus cerebriforme]
MIFQVGLTLSQDTPGTQGTIFPPTLFKSSFQDLLILNGTNYFIVEIEKNFEAHPCYDVENCDFSVVSCSPIINKCKKTLAGSLYLTQPDVIIWFLFSLDFTEPIEMKVSIRVNNTITLPTPIILSPHPADSPPLNGDPTSDGYANCGTMEFDDFRVDIQKRKIILNFMQEAQVRVILLIKNSFPIQVNVGPFIITQKFQTGFNDRFPDALFNAPGTGAYAILKFQDINIGCATAPVGKKWLNANSNTGDVDIAENSGAVINKSSFTKTPSIYDLISVAQWIITTALLTLPNLPAGYRQFASNFGCSTGTGGGINVQAFSNAADNLRRLVCLLPSVLSTFRIDENILWNDEYKIVYGVLYTDYLKNRAWFFIPLMIFQTFPVYRYKPYEIYLVNILNMILSSGRLLVLFLLIPFLGGHVTITPATRYSLAVVLIVIQIVMAASDINNEEKIDQNQERPVDDDSSIKE